MNGQMNRRTALGAVVAAGAAGLASVVSGSSVLSAAPRRGQSAPNDPLGPVIADELENSVRELIRHPGPGGRRFAGALRVHAAHFRAQGGDDKLAEHFAAMVRTQGRDSVLMLEPDMAAVRSAARRLGIEHYTPSPIDPAVNAAALTGLLAGQYSKFIERSADKMDEASAKLEARNTPGLRPVIYYDADCIRYMEVESWAWWVMKVSCEAVPIFEGAGPACAAATVVYFGVWAVNQMEGCHG